MRHASQQSDVITGDTFAHFCEITQWIAEVGIAEQYRPIMLTVQTPKGIAIVGVALLLKDLERHINEPFETVALLSKALYDGSVSTEKK